MAAVIEVHVVVIVAVTVIAAGSLAVDLAVSAAPILRRHVAEESARDGFQ